MEPQVVVSDVVRGMARSPAGVEFEDRGKHEMKGVGEPVRVYAVQVDGRRSVWATVILASRIAAKAGAGEILVPDTVRGLLSGKGFMFSDRGEFIPKGFDEGMRLYEVRWQ